MAMVPHERSLVEKHKDKPFALLGVTIDPPSLAKQTAKDKDMNWRNWADPDEKIAGPWKVIGYPTIYLIDGKGIIRNFFPGKPDDQELEDAIEKLMKEAAG